MDIKNLQELAKIADLCRKKGIESIKITSECVEFKLGEKPAIQKRMSSKAKAASDKIESSELSEEDVLMWSAN